MTIGENHDNLRTKVVPHTTNKTEQTRGGQKERHVPMDEPEEQGWELHLRDDGKLRKML